jgi:hypothetical protein
MTIAPSPNEAEHREGKTKRNEKNWEKAAVRDNDERSDKGGHQDDGATVSASEMVEVMIQQGDSSKRPSRRTSSDETRHNSKGAGSHRMEINKSTMERPLLSSSDEAEMS